MIEPGSLVWVTTAAGEEQERRALTGVTDGIDFQVVWVCPEGEWERAHLEGREPEGLPWPADAVREHNGAASAVG